MGHSVAIIVWALSILFVIVVFAILNTTPQDREEKVREAFWKRYERK